MTARLAFHLRARLLASLAALFAATSAAPTLAHPGFPATALVTIDRDARLTLTIRHDALAFALNDFSASIDDAPMLELLDAPEHTQQAVFDNSLARFSSHTRVLADHIPIALTITEHPDPAALTSWKLAHPSRRLPVKLDFAAAAQLPPSTRSISIRFPEIMGDVMCTIDRFGHEPLGLPLTPGEISPPLELSLLPNSALDSAENFPQPPLHALATPPWHSIALRYIRLGFTHIIPRGVDHLLFVLALFLLSPRVTSLLWQITAFTIAHSVTLTLATLHLLNVPSFIVEPIIAASIACVAIENLFVSPHPAPRRWRALIAFAFGLVHGLGFASALSDVGLPTGQLITGLTAFSIGVECGHIAVLLLAFALLAWSRDKPWYRVRITIPASLAIAAIALFWTIERTIGAF